MRLYSMKKTWNPEIFQGHKKNRNYFEGWYFKVVDNTEKNIYAFIPGVSYENEESLSHAFIQVIDGKRNETYYFKYPLNEFKYSIERFEIWIGDSYFSLDEIRLSIDKSDKKIKGNLKFHKLVTWPTKTLSPGAMGWYSFIPFMECNHGILSLNHFLEGSINIDKNKINFTNGKGYIEKDWGSSFPRAWIWIQSNHFDDEIVSLTASIAKIPWIKSEFTGFIIGLLYKEKLYKFTTYTGAEIKKIDVKGNNVLILVQDDKYILEIMAVKNMGGELYSPNKGIMKDKINESLTSKVRIKLFENNTKGKELVYSGEGRNTGMEVTNAKELL